VNLRRPHRAWPGSALLTRFAVIFLVVSLLFAVVYGGADAITARRAHRLRVDLPFEAAIPFVPGLAWIYMSIYLPFLAAPFLLRSRRELDALAAALAVVIVTAGLVFLLLPAELGYPPPPGLGRSAGATVFRIADRLNLEYNLVPSLHVALSAACLAVYARRAAAGGRLLLGAWALAIGASTLLTHQHHLLDIVTGYALAVAAVAWVYRPLAAVRPPSASS
jgi:membrane-associated phospholipid phosphatase